MANETRKIDNVLADLNEQAKAATAAVRAKDMVALNAAEDKLKELSKEYEAFALQALYAQLDAAADPVLEAIKVFTYGTKKSRPVKSDGIIMSYEIVDATKTINLLAYCKHLKDANTDWQYDVQKLNKSLTLRTAQDLNLPAAKVNEIKTTFAMDSRVAGDKVEIPTSNGKLVKMVQAIVDQIIFKAADGSDVNDYKVTTHDINYLLAVYAQRDKQNVLGVKVSRHKDLTIEIATICHKIVTNGTYDVVYAKKKS